MGDKYNLIEQILLEIKGTTGINFQYKIREILKKYYKLKNLTYEMPRHYGGDKKNDGWVKEEDLYYQIFSPVQIKANDTLKKEIARKFKEDLEKLLEILYIEKLWTKNIKKFIFLVNTIDTPLPEDSSNEYEKIASKLKKQYNTSFEFEVVNTDYIRDILEEIDEISILESIASILRVKHLINENTCNAQDIYEVICGISRKMNEAFCYEQISKNYYKRISSENKININNLKNKKERIETIISKLDVVEKAIFLLNEDLEDQDKFEKAKKYVIDKYMGLKNSFSNEKIYDKMIEESFDFINCKENFLIAIEYFIVYIFDKCDIFEKEEKDDFTK